MRIRWCRGTIGLYNVHALGGIENIAEANTFAADKRLRFAQGSLHLSETPNRLHIGTLQANNRRGIAKTPIILKGIFQTVFAAQITIKNGNAACHWSLFV